jgi:GNAT superfamily N-acetyltransferase
MIIRELTPGDHAQWLTLWDSYNAFYGREGSTALPPEITETTWHRFFDDEEPVHALVADVDGQLVGLAHYLFHRSTISIGPICYLQDLFTSETARGQGVATQLVERVSSGARARGAKRVYWQTHETNIRARKLYDRIAERSGFIVYRRPL